MQALSQLSYGPVPDTDTSFGCGRPEQAPTRTGAQNTRKYAERTRIGSQMRGGAVCSGSPPSGTLDRSLRLSRPINETPPIGHNSACRNCSATLAGPYCAQCGQHAHESAHSLQLLFHDAWHLLTHLDGRLWGTLAPLLVQPGRLTGEYFADHRARYVPPFRLYLVISVAFFGLASLTTTVSNVAAVHSSRLSTSERAELHRELQDSGASSAVTATVE